MNGLPKGRCDAFMCRWTFLMHTYETISNMNTFFIYFPRFVSMHSSQGYVVEDTTSVIQFKLHNSVFANYSCDKMWLHCMCVSCCRRCRFYVHFHALRFWLKYTHFRSFFIRTEWSLCDVYAIKREFVTHQQHAFILHIRVFSAALRLSVANAQVSK